MTGLRIEDLTPEERAAEVALHRPLADAVRGLVDATIRTTVDDDEVRAVTAEVEALVARLRARQLDGAFGVRYAHDGPPRNHGNAVVGLRNAVAPPLKIVRDREAMTARAEFELGAAYEGPDGLVHGGVSALVLDQVAGEAASLGGSPGMTGTLTLRYRRGTPLGRLTAEARIDRVEGWKTFVTGHLGDAEGPTVEFEAVFVTPRWARALMERDRQGRGTREAPDRFE